MALDQIPVVYMRCVRSRVDVKRVDSLPLKGQLVFHLQVVVTITGFYPVHFRLIAHHRAFKDSRRERHQIIQKLSERRSPIAI